MIAPSELYVGLILKLSGCNEIISFGTQSRRAGRYGLAGSFANSVLLVSYILYANVPDSISERSRGIFKK
jgi:hypothetical protein